MLAGKQTGWYSDATNSCVTSGAKFTGRHEYFRICRSCFVATSSMNDHMNGNLKVSQVLQHPPLPVVPWSVGGPGALVGGSTGGSQALSGMTAWITTWGLNEPEVMYVWVTVNSLEMRAPLSSPKSQLKVMSALLRYSLGSWRVMVKAIALFWMKRMSPATMSFTWSRETAKGIWSEENRKRWPQQFMAIAGVGAFFSLPLCNFLHTEIHIVDRRLIIQNNLKQKKWNRRRFLSPLKKLTSDGELSGGVSQRNELLLAAVVVDDDVHGVGAQRDVVCIDGQGGGRSVRHLPVLTCKMSTQSLVSTTWQAYTLLPLHHL